MAKRGRRATFIQASRSKAPSEKARVHQITGAGRRRVKRPFFGLNGRDEDALVERLIRWLDARIR